MIPTAALPHRVTIAALLGDTSTGPKFAPEGGPVRARIVGTRRRVTTGNGTVTIADGTIVIRPPAVPVPVGSKVFHAGQEYLVLDTATAEELRRPFACELIVQGPK